MGRQGPGSPWARGSEAQWRVGVLVCMPLDVLASPRTPARAMTTRHQVLLDELGRRLETRGFRFRRRTYFASSGILVMTQPRAAVPSAEPSEGDYTLTDVWYFERAVMLYPFEGGWEARVTRHGGPHWVRRVGTLDAMESCALEALGTSAVPPGPAWHTADEQLD